MDKYETWINLKHGWITKTLDQTTQYIGRQFTDRFCLYFDVVHLIFTSIHPIGRRQLPAIHKWLVYVTVELRHHNFSEYHMDELGKFMHVLIRWSEELYNCMNNHEPDERELGHVAAGSVLVALLLDPLELVTMLLQHRGFNLRRRHVRRYYSILAIL